MCCYYSFEMCEQDEKKVKIDSACESSAALNLFKRFLGKRFSYIEVAFFWQDVVTHQTAVVGL